MGGDAELSDLSVAGVVESAVDLDPAPLYAAGSDLRARAWTYGRQLPVGAAAWSGAVARDMATAVGALSGHEAGHGQDNLRARLLATASYVEAVADWQQGVRDDVARVLATVMTSGEAVAVRSARSRPANDAAPTAVRITKRCATRVSAPAVSASSSRL